MDGLLKIIFNPADQRVLGIAIIGDGAAELIHVGMTAMMYGATLDAFLQMPARAVPGTKMVYIGLRDAADRAALICFLEQKTRGF